MTVEAEEERGPPLADRIGTQRSQGRISLILPWFGGSRGEPVNSNQEAPSLEADTFGGVGVDEENEHEEDDSDDENKELSDSAYETNEEVVDIFQDALEHLQSSKIDDNLEEVYYETVEFRSTEDIFNEPPGLLGIEEYQIAIAECVTNGLSWMETFRLLFQNHRHPQIEKTVYNLYCTVLAEQVEYQISEKITWLCCSQDGKLLKFLSYDRNPNIDSILWVNVIASAGDRFLNEQTTRLLLQFNNFKTLPLKHEEHDGRKDDKQLSKLQRKVLSSWNKLINELVPHFFDDSAEQKLLRCISNWFKSGEMSHSQFDQWRSLWNSKFNYGAGQLKKVRWNDETNAKEHLSLFNLLVDDISGGIPALKELLDSFLSPPLFELIDEHLKVIGNVMFLNDILPEIMKQKSDSMKEINVFATHAFGIDCNLEKNDWHGINVTIVADKITVWKQSIIDVSGLGYYPQVRPARERGGNGKEEMDGKDGDDGKAGESGGNVAIFTNKLRGQDKLTVKLNGGHGEGGQHGGDGADGKSGVGITEAEFKGTILPYTSLARTQWSIFDTFNPSPLWKVLNKENVNVSYGKWIYRTYEDKDGRQLVYSFAGDRGWVYTTYDIMFLIKGSAGTAGGQGGRDGLSGEGGNHGTFTARGLMTHGELKSFVNVQQKGGKSGKEAQVGRSGTPGINGNDMAMTDRSTGSWDWERREARKYFGDATKYRLQMNFSYTAADGNALDGLRTHLESNEKKKKFYIEFNVTDIPSNSITKEAKKKTPSERASHSLAVDKQSISSNKLLEEFSEICGRAAMKMGDVADFREIKIDEDEEVKEEQQIQEEITIARTFVENEHEKILRQAVAKENEVIKKINDAATEMSSKACLVDLISIWKDVFTVPLDIIQLKAALDVLLYRLDKMIEITNGVPFLEDGRLPNGMTRQKIVAFAKATSKKFRAKTLLSSFSNRIDPDSHCNMDLVILNEELVDVDYTPLGPFWMEVEKKDYKANLIDSLFNQIDSNHLCSSKALLMALYKINKFLKEGKDVFKPFERPGFDWADVPAVQNYLQSFLTEEEKKKLAEKREKRLEETEKEAAAVNISWGYFKTSTTYFSTTEESIAFKDVAQQFNDDKDNYFSALTSWLQKNRRQEERFSIDRHWITNQLKEPGSSPQSLVHMYYLTEQILAFNVRLMRYYLPYSKSTTAPEGWYDSSAEIPMETVDDLVKWCETQKPPKIDSNMQSFIDKNGIKCRAYRQMVADDQNINIQVFCESGFGKVRLVENLNPQAEVVHRLIFNDGELRTVSANKDIRRIRAHINSYKLDIPLPMSTGSLQLCSYFPDAYEEKISEWTAAIIAATGSDMVPRFFQELFELRGNSMSIVDLQFAFNTIIEVNKNFDIPLEQLCKTMLLKDGRIHDIFLDLRVIFGSFKGRFSAGFSEKRRNLLATITEPHLTALFGSKLHEMALTEEDFTNLVNMLAHASDRVAELEIMTLREWVDIANCQRWSSYGPLLEAYGNVGYYIVLLNTIGRDEGHRLEKIIAKMKKNNGIIIILEKILSTLAFLISNNEVVFDNDYGLALCRFLQLVSKKCSTAREKVHDLLPKYGLLPEDVQLAENDSRDDILFVTNEIQQQILLGIIDERVKKQMEAVMPRTNRSLEDLVRLSVNPQDSDAERERRRQEMTEIQKILSNIHETKDPYGQMLKEIDDKLWITDRKGLRDTQKIAILAAQRSEKNLLSQVNTGEGKSYLIACLAILRIRTNPKDTVDIITSSSVLAQRDAEDMRALFNEFGIEVGHNCDEDEEKRKLAYKCGVVYGDIAHFEKDYLLHTFYKKNILGSRERCNVIVDEVDVMLLDYGCNMLYLSHNVAGMELLDSLFVYLHKLVNTPSLNEEDAVNFSSLRLKEKVLADMCGMVTKGDVERLLSHGDDADSVGKIWRLLVNQKVIDSEGVVQCNWNKNNAIKELQRDCGVSLADRVLAMLEIVNNRHREIDVPAYLIPFVISHLDDFIKNAKQGLFINHKDDYVVDVDRTGRSTDLYPGITIIDKGTGTDLSTSQWSGGLHQSIQLKHGCRLTPFSLKAVFISNVSYLKGYRRLNGFSGTLGSVEENNSLGKLYNADLLKIPTWKPKMFSEKTPILSKNKEKWIKAIFNEICDQIRVDRSVLVICQSIEKVEELSKQFGKLLKKMKTPSERLSKAFDNIVAYTREFDDVADFAAGKELSSGKIIISTNLSGRGTDITLNCDLEKNGGLHVIVSFLPENSRIENQAYGRAARGGQQGSGQIICIVDEEKGASNIFQLKQFRDNAEVHRLRSLKQYYDYHIDVEETCLTLFKDHCSPVMEAVHSQTTSEELTILVVIYFALLDEWAIWMDSIGEELRQCEKTKNDVFKNHIIASTKTFLERHPLPISVEYSRSLEWIRSPQPLLSIASIYLEKKEIDQADAILNKVIQNFPGFEAEVYYYKAVIEQWNIHHALSLEPAPEEEEEEFETKEGEIEVAEEAKEERDEEKELGAYQRGKRWLKKKAKYMNGQRLKATNWIIRDLLFDDDCPDWIVQKCTGSIEKATDYFLLSRALFVSRIAKRQIMAGIVGHLQKNLTAIPSRGFQTQQEEVIAIWECLIGSIDDLLGHKVTLEEVKLQDQLHRDAVLQFSEMMRRQEIITPPRLASKISNQQLQLLSASFGLPVPIIKQGIQLIRDDNEIEEYQKGKIVAKEDLERVFALPNVRDFWELLRREGCFHSEQHFIAVKKEDKERVPVLKDINPTPLKLQSLQILRSIANLDDYDLYDMCGSMAKMMEDDRVQDKIQEAKDAGLLRMEAVAIVNATALSKCHFLNQFSTIHVKAVAAELAVSPAVAEWILETLASHGVVEKREATIIHPEKSDTEVEESTTAGSDQQKGKDGILVVYVPIKRINCEMFPLSMRSTLETMLTRNFLYFNALKVLKASIIKEASGEKVTRQIYLPLDPYADLYKELQKLEIVEPSRVTSILVDVYTPTDTNAPMRAIKEPVEKDTSGAKAMVDTNSSKIKRTKKTAESTTRIYPIDEEIYRRLLPKVSRLCARKCDLEVTSAYLAAKKAQAGGEIRKVMANGLRKIAVVNQKNAWKWFCRKFSRAAPIALATVVAGYFFPIVTLTLVIAMATKAVTLGTMSYYTALFTENQKIASKLKFGMEEEVTLLRTFHNEAVSGPAKRKAQEVEKKIMQVEKSVDTFIHLLIHKLGLSTYVTSSDQDVSLWVEALEHCCQTSTYLPLLQHAIELWFKYNTRKMQADQFGIIFNQKRVEKTTKITSAPLIIFAFSSVLIAEVNMRNTDKNRRKKAISAELDFKSFPISRKNSVFSSESDCPLSMALSNSLKKILAPMIEESIKTVVDPALSGLDTAWRMSREVNITNNRANEQEGTLKKKQMQHSAERMANRQTVDFLAADLHNIFQRIAFRELSNPMLQHMINFNYPLSPHCAKKVLDACVLVLLTVESDLQQVDIELKRDERTILSFTGWEAAFAKKKPVPLVIRLNGNSFYITKTKEDAQKRGQSHTDLFQALCASFPNFNDRFGRDSQTFVNELQDKVPLNLSPGWNSTICWYGNEKLKCAVAI